MKDRVRWESFVRYERRAMIPSQPARVDERTAKRLQAPQSPNVLLQLCVCNAAARGRDRFRKGGGTRSYRVSVYVSMVADVTMVTDLSVRLSR